MRTLIIALAVLVMAIPAVAGTNPNLSIFLDADIATPGAQNTVCPAASDLFSIYICFGDFGEGSGMTGASLMLAEPAGLMYLSTTNMLGGLIIGTPATGLSLTALECQYPDAEGVVVAASVMYMNLGCAGAFTILPDPGQGNVATDCNVDLDTWCVASVARNGTAGNLGICIDEIDVPDGDCEPVTPVETSSWGGIKALYR